MKPKIKVGADPELFLRRGETVVSGHSVIPGSKETPWPVNKGAVQVDGMALEFNIEPANTQTEFRMNINTVMAELRKMVPRDLEFHIEPAVMFDRRYMDEEVPDFAKELGCMPDFNAYTMEENPRPDANTLLRTAAGHVHIGWCEGVDPYDPGHMRMCSAFVKQLDYYLGLPSLLVDPDTTRRSLYGKPGSFRPKSYGVEYRVLSNFWIKSDAAIDWVYDAVLSGFYRMLDGDIADKRYNGYALSTIDRNDRNIANQLIDALSINRVYT